jgi:hypothetical protein
MVCGKWYNDRAYKTHVTFVTCIPWLYDKCVNKTYLKVMITEVKR